MTFPTADIRRGNPDCVPPSATLYQHISIRNSLVNEKDTYGFRYIVEVDCDPKTRKPFRTYNEALLWVITYLSQARQEEQR